MTIQTRVESTKVNQLADQPAFNAIWRNIPMSHIGANSSSAEPASLPLSCPTPPVLQPIILVVEDHDDTREMLCMLVEGWGFRAVEACNGLEGVEAALRERPKLILIDSRLPFIDGLEATRRIRENGLLAKVKILALNGSGSPHYHEQALAAGCNDTMEKPFDIERLRTYVVGALFSTTLI